MATYRITPSGLVNVATGQPAPKAGYSGTGSFVTGIGVPAPQQTPSQKFDVVKNEPYVPSVIPIDKRAEYIARNYVIGLDASGKTIYIPAKTNTMTGGVQKFVGVKSAPAATPFAPTVKGIQAQKEQQQKLK